MADIKPVLILNGPNLNMLGTREPDIYGSETLTDIEAACRNHATKKGLALDFRQSNSEAELIGWIQAAKEDASAVIINAGALTHTSVGLLDALSMLDLPITEVHLSNIYRREPFRHHSYISRAATGIICGFGWRSYILALDAVAAALEAKETR